MAFNNTKTPRKTDREAKYQLPMRVNPRHGKKEYYFTAELEAKFRGLYPIHSNRRIMAWFGISFSTTQKFKKKLGLKKNMKAIKKEQARDIKKICEKNGYYDSIRGRRPSEATIEATKRMWAEGFHPMHALKEKNPRRYRKVCEKRGQARREIFRKERLRMKYGLERKTKLRVPLQKLSHAAYSQKSAMITQNNYFADENHTCWVCYDSETRRSPKREATAIRHGLKIVEGKDTVTITIKTEKQ